jgi:hypothetical protein
MFQCHPKWQSLAPLPKDCQAEMFHTTVESLLPIFKVASQASQELSVVLKI